MKPECPKLVRVTQLTERGVERYQVECENLRSPGYYHCVDHITDKEFMRKRAGKELQWK